MATARTLAWVERLVWTLVYGGLFTVVIGLATWSRDRGTAGALVIAGALVAAAGVALIWVRARLDKGG